MLLLIINWGKDTAHFFTFSKNLNKHNPFLEEKWEFYDVQSTLPVQPISANYHERGFHSQDLGSIP